MKSLNTQDFLESYKALHLAKYPSLDTNEHVVLSAVLSVCIEFNKSFDEIQERLDEMTQQNKTELTHYLAEKAGV